MFISSTINVFVFYLEGGLETPEKEQKLEKSFCRTLYQLRVDLRKWGKQGRNEKKQQDYPTYSMYILQELGSLTVFFHLCLVSVLFSGPSLTEMKFYKNFSLLIIT